MKLGNEIFPEKWILESLGDLMSYEQPYGYIVDSEFYDDNSGIPVLTAGKSFILGYTSENNNIYKNLPVIIFDDFTTENKFVNFPFKVKSSAMKFLKPKSENLVDLRFIYYYLQELKLKDTGGDHKRRWISEFSKIKIRIPQYSEQIKIADIITKLDEAIVYTELLINKSISTHKGLMKDLLTLGIHSSNKLIKSKLKDIVISNDFIQTTFEKFTSVRQGFQIPISNRKKNEGVNRYIYITVQYLNNPTKYLEYIENPPENVICNEEDILFTRTGNTGQIISNIKGVFHNNFFKISFDEKLITREYLIFYLNWEPVQQLIKELAGTTTIPDMKHKDFYKMPIFFPSTLEEQKEISRFLNSSEKTILNYKRQLKKLNDLKQGLMQDLLSGKVRVNY